MTVKLHGYFLLTGETVPLEDSLTSDVEQHFARVVSHLGLETVEILVLVTEVITRRSGIEKRCRIRTHVNGRNGPTVDGSGSTIRQAVIRALDQVVFSLSDPVHNENAETRLCG